MRDRLLHSLNVLSLVVLIALPFAWSVGTPMWGSVSWLDRIVDFKLIHEHSRVVVIDHVYPAVFPYPPSAICFFYLFGMFPFSSSALVWLVVIAAATTSTFILLSRLVGLEQHPLRWFITLVGMGSVGYFIVTDLRASNCNMIYLLLLTVGITHLHEGQIKRGSLFLAASMSLKLYSVATFAYLIARGDWRTALRTFGWLALLWMVLPLATYGLDGSLAVYRAWWDQVQRLMLGPDHYDFMNLASLRKGLYAQYPIETATQILVFCRGTWGGLLAVSLILAAVSTRRGSTRGGIDWALGAGLMALAIGATSPFLEVYHFVPAALLSMGFLGIICNQRESARLRLLMGSTMLAAWSILKFGPKGTERGIGLYAYAVCLAAGLILVWLTKAPTHCSGQIAGEEPESPSFRASPSKAA